MAVNRWREVRYVDDGCSRYQCLSCKEQWEGRSSPEWGWKFCPYCGVQWQGEVKGRSSDTPKWRWNLIERFYQSGQEIDYNVINARQDLINENRIRVESNLFVWCIEYQEKGKDHWCCDDAFTHLLNSIGPLHKSAYERMVRARELYESEREESIRGYWGGDDDGEIVSTLGEEYLTDMCDRMYPARIWRIQFMKKSKFQKLYPSKHIY